MLKPCLWPATSWVLGPSGVGTGAAHTGRCGHLRVRRFSDGRYDQSPITVVAQPVRAIGETAALLLERMQEQTTLGARQILLEACRSSGPPLKQGLAFHKQEGEVGWEN